MMKILVVDDHALVRKGIAQALEPVDAEIDEVASGQEALDKISGIDYRMVLLDISMPGRSGLETLARIKKLQPLLPVLTLTMYPEEQYAIRALKSGAAGYLTKNCSTDELIAAVRKIAAGKRHFSPDLMEILADEVSVEKPKDTVPMRPSPTANTRSPARSPRAKLSARSPKNSP